MFFVIYLDKVVHLLETNLFLRINMNFRIKNFLFKKKKERSESKIGFFLIILIY